MKKNIKFDFSAKNFVAVDLPEAIPPVKQMTVISVPQKKQSATESDRSLGYSSKLFLPPSVSQVHNSLLAPCESAFTKMLVRLRSNQAWLVQTVLAKLGNFLEVVPKINKVGTGSD